MLYSHLFTNLLKTFIQNHIKIEQDLLLQIFNETEIWNLNKKINYCCLFCDNNTVLAIEFNKKGESIKKSFLYVEEELDILEISQKFHERYFTFNITKKDKLLFKTRKQMKEEKFIKYSLKNIEDKKLNYIFFECFGYHEKNKKIIFDRINKIDKNSKTYKNLYDILKLTSTTKK